MFGKIQQRFRSLPPPKPKGIFQLGTPRARVREQSKTDLHVALHFLELSAVAESDGSDHSER